MDNTPKILIVDDEENIRRIIKKALEKKNYVVHTAPNAEDALRKIKNQDYFLVFSDIFMDGMSGLDLLQEVKKDSPQLKIVVMTAQYTMNNTIEAMKAGAFEFVTKPFDILQIEELVRQALKVRHAEKRDSSDLKSGSEELLVGQGPKVRELFKSIGRVASTELTVHNQGESGPGKELIAKPIPQQSNRSKVPFLAITKFPTLSTSHWYPWGTLLTVVGSSMSAGPLMKS